MVTKVVYQPNPLSQLIRILPPSLHHLFMPEESQKDFLSSSRIVFLIGGGSEIFVFHSYRGWVTMDGVAA